MKKIIALTFVLVLVLTANAQMNSLRLGILGLPYGGVNVKYERLLSDNMSIGLTAGLIAPRRVKFLENVLNTGDTTELSSKFVGFSLVPEFRFYKWFNKYSRSITTD